MCMEHMFKKGCVCIVWGWGGGGDWVNEQNKWQHWVTQTEYDGLTDRLFI